MIRVLGGECLREMNRYQNVSWCIGGETDGWFLTL